MSQENVELRGLAEAAFEAINSGDLESLVALTTEDCEFTSMVAEAEGTTFRGHDGVRTWWKTVRGAFDAVRWELIDVRASGDRGVAHFRMAGSLGSVPVEQTMWQTVKLRDGKVFWWAFFRTEGEALEAAGLSERGAFDADSTAPPFLRAVTGAAPRNRVVPALTSGFHALPARGSSSQLGPAGLRDTASVMPTSCVILLGGAIVLGFLVVWRRHRPCGATDRPRNSPGAGAVGARRSRRLLSLRDTARAMSQENVEVVRALFEAVNRRDYASAVEYVHPEAEIYPGIAGLDPAGPGSGSRLCGRDEVRQFFERCRCLGGDDR